MTFRFLSSKRRQPRRRDPDELIKTFWRTLERIAQSAHSDRGHSGSH